MKITQIFERADNWQKASKDPRISKLIGIHFKHDNSAPPNLIAKVGPRGSDEEITLAIGKMIDDALSNTNYGNANDGKFDDWLIRQYANGATDLEDIIGQASDTLGAYRALSIRGMLDEPHKDFNKFKNLKTLQKILAEPKYANALKQIADSERIEKAKRDQKSVTLIDDDKYYVGIPLN